MGEIKICKELIEEVRNREMKRIEKEMSKRLKEVMKKRMKSENIEQEEGDNLSEISKSRSLRSEREALKYSRRGSIGCKHRVQSRVKID